MFATSGEQAPSNGASPCAVVVRFVGRDRRKSHRRRTAAFVSTRKVLLAPAKGGNRRNSVAAARPREGPLTELTADAQRWPRERVLMPQSGHSVGQDDHVR